MEKQALDSIIDATEGRIFSVVFIKKYGTERKMIARLGVTKYLKGGNATLDKDQYIIAFDLVKKAYRAINRDTIISISAMGETHAA